MPLTKQEFDELVAKAGTGTLSDEEAAALEPYRAKNAVILVAGNCRRFAPISFDYPKPLVEVRGEVLVERQIRQLLSVGITDIALVVGFMKEKYEYLGEKYGVSLVESPEFMLTNNIVSLVHAADRLGNTYILYGDQYFTVNPFERFVYRSFYATTLAESDDEWVMETNPEGVVVDMISAADGGEKLQGPCYVDAETGAALAAALMETIADKTTVDKTWEYAWYLHRDKLAIATRYYPAGVVTSFKSMDELKAFDDSYLLHVKSPAMDNICSVLNCTYEDMYAFEPLVAGLTNYSVAFNVGNERYVYRHAIGYGPINFDRAVETKANKIAFEVGLDPTFIYEDPETGWKLCHFIKGVRPLDRENQDEATLASELIGKFQRATVGETVDAEYDRWKLAVDYENRIRERGFQFSERTLSYIDRMYKLAELVEADNFPKCLSHNDYWYSNMLFDEDGRLNIIDWEYAAMADWLSDCAMHTNGFYISVPLDDLDFPRRQLRAFLQREETFEEWRHFQALNMICAWKTALWVIDWVSGMDESTDWDIDVWIQLDWDYLDLHLDNTIAMYEQA